VATGRRQAPELDGPPQAGVRVLSIPAGGGRCERLPFVAKPEPAFDVGELLAVEVAEC
jgi:hypothetical protein